MEKNEEFKAMLGRIKKQYGKTLRAIADDIGVNYTYLSDITSGRSPLTDAMKGKIMQKYGRAIVYPDDPMPPRFYGGGEPVPENMVLLPLIPLEAAAGFPSFDNDGISLDDCEQYAIPEFTARGAEFLVRVSGTSMYPRYNNGDILACRRVQKMTFFQWGMVYVIDTEQGMLVKRLYECPNDDDAIVCKSENETEFPPFKLPKSEIRSVSIVLGQISVS